MRFKIRGGPVLLLILPLTACHLGTTCNVRRARIAHPAAAAQPAFQRRPPDLPHNLLPAPNRAMCRRPLQSPA